MNGILIGSSIEGQSGPGSNVNDVLQSGPGSNVNEEIFESDVGVMAMKRYSKVDLGVIAMKECSTFPKASESAKI